MQAQTHCDTHTHTQVRVIRSRRVSAALHHWVIHLEWIHVYKAFPTWTKANPSASTSHGQIYQLTNWKILGHVISCWLNMCKSSGAAVVFGFFSFTGWESLFETAPETEWWDVLRQRWWLYCVPTHTWAHAHINIAARAWACGRTVWTWGHSLVHAWTHEYMWICRHKLALNQGAVLKMFMISCTKH